MKNSIQKSRKYNGFKTVSCSAFLSLIMMCYSCDDFVNVDLPTTQLSSNLVFEDYNTATAAVLAVYAQIRDKGLTTGNPSGMQIKLGEYTDELQFFGAGGQTDASFYSNIVLPNNNTVKNWWNNTYSQIYATNAILEGVQKSTALNTNQKNQLTGEALFCRALLHFYLTNLYGDIPYITNTNYNTNTTIPKTSVNIVYEKLEADLLIAEALLNLEYLNSERIRPNKATVQALLARLYLYSGKWSAAENAASAILKNTAMYEGTQSLDEVFLKDSFSTIWQLSPNADGENTLEAGSNIFMQGPPPGSALSENFVNSFESGDQRRTSWIKAVTNGTTTWHHAFKYKTFENTGTSVEYSIMFRTAEIYLIRAEARAQSGNPTDATIDLNRIRNPAGLNNTTAMSMQDIIKAILKERHAELFTEGHRFFDLKRTLMLNEVLTPIKPGWDAKDILFPIPDTELLLNPNLNPQNPGY